MSRATNPRPSVPAIPLHGILFDLDGTLADTLPVCFAAFRNALRAETGKECSDQEIRAMFGPTEEGILRRLAPDRYESALDGFLADYERFHAACSSPFDGIAEALERLRGAGARLGVVTGKGPRTTAISLRVLGLHAFFQDIETGSEAHAIKPRCIARILGRWSLPAARVAYVGDSPYDVRAAKEAGVLPVGAAWAPATDAAELRAAGSERVFEAIEGFEKWALAELLD